MHHIFSALSDPTRLSILSALQEGPLPVGELVKKTNFSGATISRHLDALERGTLVVRRKDGNRRICHLNGEGFQIAHEWLEQYEQFWQGALNRLENVMDQQTETKT